MKETWVFDTRPAQRISERRKECAERLLRNLLPGLGLKTTLDVGCGVGFFSEFLRDLGLRVTAFDAREGNIAEAKSRYPEVEFHVYDVEDSKVQELGSFDLVLCFGLLYHLENPFRAIRNLQALTRKALLIESLVAPDERPIAALVGECLGEDQSLRYIAFVPSETCLVKMLYACGFSWVYKTQFPNHEEFRETLSYKRRRTVLVASRSSLSISLLQWVPEPQQQLLWSKVWRYPLDYLGSLRDMLMAKLLSMRD